MARSAASTGARSTGGCAEHCWLRGAPSAASPPHPTALEATTGAGGTPRRTPGAGRRRSVASDAHAALRPDCLYAGSGDTTRVRGSCRGFGAQDGVATPVQWGKTPSRGANPRPEGHDGHLSEEASPGLTHGLTRVTPRPRTRGRGAGLRTRGGVVDVRQGCGRALGLPTFPRGASATPGHVHTPQARPQRDESLAQVRRPIGASAAGG